jgi:hypothetical protein
LPVKHEKIRAITNGIAREKQLGGGAIADEKTDPCICIFAHRRRSIFRKNILMKKCMKKKTVGRITGSPPPPAYCWLLQAEAVFFVKNQQS